MTTIRQAIREETEKLQEEARRIQARLAKLASESKKIPASVMDIDTPYPMTVAVYSHCVDIYISGPPNAIDPFFDAAPERYNVSGDCVSSPSVLVGDSFERRGFYFYPESESGKYATELYVLSRRDASEQ